MVKSLGSKDPGDLMQVSAHRLYVHVMGEKR